MDKPSNSDPAWALWVWGIKGPQFVVIRRPMIDGERRGKLAEPVLIAEGDRGLPLALLARLYPPPCAPEPPPSPALAPALAVPEAANVAA